MTFKIYFTDESRDQFQALERDAGRAKRLRAVRKALGLMEDNLRHASLQTHKHSALSDEYGIDVFEAYAENQTPGAYRIFWHYGPGKGAVTIISILPHP